LGFGGKRRDGGNGAGEVKVKVRGVHLLLMVFEDDKERNECVWILLCDGQFCPHPSGLVFMFPFAFLPGESMN